MIMSQSLRAPQLLDYRSASLYGKKIYNLSWSLAGAVAALEYNSMLGLVLAYEVSSDHKMFGDFCIEIGQLVVQAADLEVEWRSKGAKNMCISSYVKIYHGPTGHQ